MGQDLGNLPDTVDAVDRDPVADRSAAGPVEKLEPVGPPTRGATPRPVADEWVVTKLPRTPLRPSLFLPDEGIDPDELGDSVRQERDVRDVVRSRVEGCPRPVGGDLGQGRRFGLVEV